MKVLVIGANGMLGHVLFEILKSCNLFETYGFCGKSASNTSFLKSNFQTLKILDVSNLYELEKELSKIEPDVVINCSVKKKPTAGTIEEFFIINSFLPQRIAILSDKLKFKFLHISSDSVLGSQKGKKDESYQFCADSYYAASKLMGEPLNGNTLILRTSIVGHSLLSNTGLLDFVRNSTDEKIAGYTDSFFTGTTTLELAKIIKKILNKDYDFIGQRIYNICGPRISKENLIREFIKIYEIKKKIIPTKSIPIDRSLISDKFNYDFGYITPKWSELFSDLRKFKESNHHLYET